ncbi:MAG: adventurous gliding motility TPR repeat lipoprotein GltE, partial [Myxococcaceae bacterium]
MTSVSPRLLASALASLLATACATTAPAEKAPAAPVASQPKTAPGPTAASAPSAPNARAMLLFEDATKAADAQAKSGTRDDTALERRFEAVRQADPTFAEADYNLGVLAERQGKRDQAYAFYLSALQKKPSFKAAAEGLARLT